MTIKPSDKIEALKLRQQYEIVQAERDEERRIAAAAFPKVRNSEHVRVLKLWAEIDAYLRYCERDGKPQGNLYSLALVFRSECAADVQRLTPVTPDKSEG